MNAANSLILCLTKQDMNSWWLRRGVFKLSYCSESGNVGHSDLRGIGIIVSSSSWSLAIASFKWLFNSDFGTTRKASATGSGLAVSFAVLPPILRIGIRFSNFSWPDWAKVGFFFYTKKLLESLIPLFVLYLIHPLIAPSSTTCARNLLGESFSKRQTAFLKVSH